MANVSVAVEIETRTGHDLSIAFQGVADDQSANVGTLLSLIAIDFSAKLFQKPARIKAYVVAHKTKPMSPRWAIVLYAEDFTINRPPYRTVAKPLHLGKRQ